ncbi:sensor histidine kinase [Arcobacter sp. YIC-464]|uniref:sensor histidine kinase n=1 Tax=Arcobacter sp. YIC-464 TaxID=3376631 RepID=UPI003C20D7B9
MSKRIDYLKRFVYLFILIGTTLSILILAVTFFELDKYNKKENLQNAKTEINAKIKLFEQQYQQYKGFLNSLESNLIFTNYLENSNRVNKNNLISLFNILMLHENSATQLRYIDLSGNEIIRLERRIKNDIISVIDENSLQNKAHRSYFKETINLNPNQLYMSKIDLNIERNEIEIPYKPVWRFAVPVYLENEKKGILIVNFFMEEFLKKLLESSLFYVNIFDQDNHLLLSSFHEQSWTRYLNKDKLDNTNEIVIQKELFNNIGKEKIFISFSFKEDVTDFFKYLNSELFFLLFLIIVIAFILGKWLSNIPKKLFDEIELQQKLLIQQSKHSAMGEMISMLAHQWRQPLNVISSLIQEIEIKKEMNILSDKELLANADEIKATLRHMSLTINDFRDFFKPNKTKTIFDIGIAIKEAIGLIKPRLSKNSISCEVNLDNIKNKTDIEVKNLENEFKNVVVNILNNSIDAFDSKDIEKKLIEVDIFYNRKTKEIKIEFIDNAGGIDSKILESLFKPYITTKENLNGSGLGLYMSKIIIEQNMHGVIKASNRGNKAVFTIVLKK